MIKKLLKSATSGITSKDKDLLRDEVKELEEIADKIFNKIERKIADLKEAEKSADSKIETLQMLMDRFSEMNIPDDAGVDSRYREITNLSKKGLNVDEIAKILDIPPGEVELITNLGK